MQVLIFTRLSKPEGELLFMQGVIILVFWLFYIYTLYIYIKIIVMFIQYFNGFTKQNKLESSLKPGERVRLAVATVAELPAANAKT